MTTSQVWLLRVYRALGLAWSLVFALVDVIVQQRDGQTYTWICDPESGILVQVPDLTGERVRVVPD